ncbi:hypothetical protein HDK77DRAFT_248041 [Phyllosticta capitalensis]|uniref:Uncharacterized protein n=2 Tax=Phyllosticta capitalensis TaxID=121624 RepID=A0ABR1YM08_9PEZI
MSQDHVLPGTEREVGLGQPSRAERADGVAVGRETWRAPSDGQVAAPRLSPCHDHDRLQSLQAAFTSHGDTAATRSASRRTVMKLTSQVFRWRISRSQSQAVPGRRRLSVAIPSDDGAVKKQSREAAEYFRNERCQPGGRIRTSHVVVLSVGFNRPRRSTGPACRASSMWSVRSRHPVFDQFVVCNTAAKMHSAHHECLPGPYYMQRKPKAPLFSLYSNHRHPPSATTSFYALSKNRSEQGTRLWF